jgi:hypothetical protein
MKELWLRTLFPASPVEKIATANRWRESSRQKAGVSPATFAANLKSPAIRQQLSLKAENRQRNASFLP